MTSIGFYESISEEIITDQRFINDYQNLITQSYDNKFEDINNDVYKRLMESASIFSCANDDLDLFRKLALKIVTSVLENNQSNSILKAASELIFLRLGNFPTLEMSIDRNLTADFFHILKENDHKLSNNGYKTITTSISAEIIGKIFTNRHKIAETYINFTDFQSKVFNLLKAGKNISLSAPTSAGKSFVLTKFVADCLIKKNNHTIVYLVPSRALITQVQKEFRKVLNDYNITNTKIFTSSYDVLNCEEEDLKRAILVLTQERLQTIEGRMDNLMVDLLIVDEAQKISENSRGIILEESVQQIIEWNPDLQKVFISPFSENPEKLAKVFSFKDIVTIKTNLSPVNQNLLNIDFDKQIVNIAQNSQELEKKIKIKRISHPLKASGSSYKLKAFVALNLVEQGSTMVYCNGASDCRKTAELISESRELSNENIMVKESVEFLKRNIHPDYFLIDFLEKGIGYHYGHMVPTIRTIVESLFRRKHIDTICCTSTLLEGVNFPAKNIIIHKPRKGKNNPMDQLSFWNLAGRAGRLMRDFSGNIYCIDVDEWPGYKPKFDVGKHTIQSSMENVITSNKKDIISHLTNFAKQKDKAVEAAVTRFLINEIRQGNDKFIKQLIERNSEIKKENLEDIHRYIKEIVSKINLDGNIILKNRVIDPRLQNDLYDYLKKMDDIPLPTHPSKDGFYYSLKEIINILNNAFKRGMVDKYISFLAMLSTKWTNEISLSNIIKNRIDYLEGNVDIKLDKKKTNDEIENIIKTINSELRFKLCRDISCYCDIAEYVLNERGLSTDEIDHNLPFYIEVGASRKTTLSLIDNGIPRTVALNIAKTLPSNVKDYSECEEFIRKNEDGIKKSITSVLFNEIMS